MKTIFVLAALAFVVPVPAVDSFIVSGYPAEDTCVSAWSEGSSLTTGTLSGESGGVAFDGRFTDSDECENGVAFDSYPPKGFCIIIR